MYQPDFSFSYKYRSAGAICVINWDERHLSAEPKSPDGIGTMYLQRQMPLHGDEVNQLPGIGTSASNVTSRFWAHIDTAIQPFELAPLDQSNYCFGYGVFSSKPFEAAYAEGLPFR